MVKQVIIVGGGTAGWLTAAYLARMLAVGRPGGAAITVIESADIPSVGVGEGTFPSIQRILQRIGVSEGRFVRACGATFKQGIRFDGWRFNPGHAGRNDYFHPFSSSQTQFGFDLLPYWLLGCAGDVQADEALTLQKRVADARRGPKRLTDGDYAGVFSYAYHFDAVAFGRLLRETAIELGVQCIEDTVGEVRLDEQGAIAGLATRAHGELSADLYVDCTGFRAQLIGQTLGSPFTSCRQQLFCDRAVTMQVPYERPDAPIASYTISAAQEAGWMWDIGLHARRGIGHVYSSDHSSDERAEEVLRAYVGPASEALEARVLKFEAGYRAVSWVKNCVAVGLSSGFFEPLEATGIVFVEVAAILLANLFPWAGEIETSARQFNRVMQRRYEGALDFLKLHYALTERDDTGFWRDNVRPETSTDSLAELLDRWRHRPPDEMDFDLTTATFHPASWQFVLYGMGFRTDLSARAAAYRYHDEARRGFAQLRQDAERAAALMPSHRELVDKFNSEGFSAGGAAT